jgi:hypothetical protein
LRLQRSPLLLAAHDFLRNSRKPLFYLEKRLKHNSNALNCRAFLSGTFRTFCTP